MNLSKTVWIVSERKMQNSRAPLIIINQLIGFSKEKDVEKRSGEND